MLYKGCAQFEVKNFTGGALLCFNLRRISQYGCKDCALLLLNDWRLFAVKSQKFHGSCSLLFENLKAAHMFKRKIPWTLLSQCWLSSMSGRYFTNGTLLVLIPWRLSSLWDSNFRWLSGRFLWRHEICAWMLGLFLFWYARQACRDVYEIQFRRRETWVQIIDASRSGFRWTWIKFSQPLAKSSLAYRKLPTWSDRMPTYAFSCRPQRRNRMQDVFLCQRRRIAMILVLNQGAFQCIAKLEEGGHFSAMVVSNCGGHSAHNKFHSRGVQYNFVFLLYVSFMRRWIVGSCLRGVRLQRLQWWFIVRDMYPGAQIVGVVDNPSFWETSDQSRCSAEPWCVTSHRSRERIEMYTLMIFKSVITVLSHSLQSPALESFNSYVVG